MTKRVGRRGAIVFVRAAREVADGLLLRHAAVLADPPYGCWPPDTSRGDGSSGEEEHSDGTGEVGGARVWPLMYRLAPVSSVPAKERGLRPSQAPSWRAGLDDETRQTAPRERRGLRSARGM